MVAAGAAAVLQRRAAQARFRHPQNWKRSRWLLQWKPRPDGESGSPPDLRVNPFWRYALCSVAGPAITVCSEAAGCSGKETAGGTTASCTASVFAP